MMNLSIIVPVYNVENYVAKCLNSIIPQLQDNSVELIIINDGSTDSSGEIVTQLIKDKNNIIYVEQSNQGLSSARNVGLSYATGRYVWFVDSDDSVSENAISTALSVFDNQEADIYSFALNAIDEKTGTSRLFGITMEEKVYSGLEYFYKGGYTSAVTRFLIKRNVLIDNGLKFKQNIYHEDNEFIPRLYYYAESVFHYNFSLYNYLLRDTGSITATFKVKRCEDLLEISKTMIDFARKRMDSKYRRVYYGYSLNQLNYALDVLAKGDEAQIEGFLVIHSSFIRKQNLHLILYNNSGLKKIFWSIIAIISPLFYIKLKRK